MAGRNLILARFPAITREALARYADASGDSNAVHIDVDAARAAGFEDVFAQGMLIMALMGRSVTDVVPLHRLRSLSTRFVGITNLGDELTCRGDITEFFEEAGERRGIIELEIRNQHEQLKLAGKAIVALESEEAE